MRLTAMSSCTPQRTIRLGDAVRALLRSRDDSLGSVLLVPEVLSKPIRTNATTELEECLNRLWRG